MAEALGGVNVGNCGHACEARPCGDAECRPHRDRFTCRCRPNSPHPCPRGEAAASYYYYEESTYTRQQKNSLLLLSRLPPPPQQQQYEKVVPSFTGSDSYLHYNDADTMKRHVNNCYNANIYLIKKLRIFVFTQDNQLPNRHKHALQVEQQQRLAAVERTSARSTRAKEPKRGFFVAGAGSRLFDARLQFGLGRGAAALQLDEARRRLVASSQSN